ncbi:hypothetical protein QP976_09555 [Corynebacterium striatum]|uniref:hypothetical protein n=2 Tax=Corynebacteriaceae TaxID=1653 RepID=UPI00254DBB79|nr:hypothetical protein [Corynebacterium striatum]MDK8813226.1 hypothetical protein [Corynebacterium striatum]
MTVVVPPQGLRRQEDISPAEREGLVMAYTKAPYGTKKAAAVAARVTPEWIRNWRAALSDAELYCERHYLAALLDLFEVRLPSYRLPPERPHRRLRRAVIQVISRRRGRLTALPRAAACVT